MADARQLQEEINRVRVASPGIGVDPIAFGAQKRAKLAKLNAELRAMGRLAMMEGDFAQEREAGIRSYDALMGEFGSMDTGLSGETTAALERAMAETGENALDPIIAQHIEEVLAGKKLPIDKGTLSKMIARAGDPALAELRGAQQGIAGHFAGRGMAGSGPEGAMMARLRMDTARQRGTAMQNASIQAALANFAAQQAAGDQGIRQAASAAQRSMGASQAAAQLGLQGDQMRMGREQMRLGGMERGLAGRSAFLQATPMTGRGSRYVPKWNFAPVQAKGSRGF